MLRRHPSAVCTFGRLVLREARFEREAVDAETGRFLLEEVPPR